jgi:hypothetical protein
MNFEEKTNWVYAVITGIVAGVYFSNVMSRVGEVPVTEIAYQKPLIIAIVAAVGLMILASIAVAIGTAVSAEIMGEGSVKDIDRKDERDIHISRRGELVGYYVSSFGAVGVLAMTMLEYPYFWIANALYLSFVMAALVSSVVKIVAYRRGF